ncbi:MAG TPA: twin-arginine translocation signal domain-containing protein [Acidimicrobiales bacterium]|nr:twin-arginine translocation signal domain-containing protein [Acidimicrobiales bacterium]
MPPASVSVAMNSESNDHRAGRIDRRRFLAAAGITTGAMWVAPTVLRSKSAWAAGSLCPCDDGTPAALQFLTAQADTTPSPLPTACLDMSSHASTEEFCRVDPTQPIYLWGTGAGATNLGPMFDDMGVVEVLEKSTNTTRWGNIYRFQNFCRHGTSIPTNLVAGYDTNKQRVYTGADVNTWDYLPPAVSGTSAGATQTATPTSWWTASQPGSPNTQSSGNPGYTATAPAWNNPIDISALFGDVCGNFTITVTDVNRYQQYKWSNIFIGTTPQ